MSVQNGLMSRDEVLARNILSRPIRGSPRLDSIFKLMESAGRDGVVFVGSESYTREGMRAYCRQIESEHTHKVVFETFSPQAYRTFVWNENKYEHGKNEQVLIRRMNILISSAFNNPSVVEIDFRKGLLDESSYELIISLLLNSPKVERLMFPGTSQKYIDAIESTLSTNRSLEELRFDNKCNESIDRIRARILGLDKSLTF